MSARRFVLLHGFTGDARVWSDVLARLGDVAASTPLLAGHDGRVASARTFEEEIDRLARVIDEGGFAGAHLVGYSLGARVALGLLARDPARFSGATLIGVHPGLRSEEDRVARRTDDAKWIDLLERRGLEAFVDRWEALPLWATQASLPEAILAQQRRSRLAHTAEGLASSLRVLGLAEMPDYWARLEELELPVTLVAGELDTKFLAIARRVAPALKKGRLAVIEGAGHNVVLERPERLAEILGMAR